MESIYVFTHYKDAKIEQCRVDTVRMDIARCGGKEWSPSEYSQLMFMARELDQSGDHIGQ